MGQKVLIYGMSYGKLTPWENDALFAFFNEGMLGTGVSWYSSIPATADAYRTIYEAVKPDMVYLPSGRRWQGRPGHFFDMVAEVPHCFFPIEGGREPVLHRIASITPNGMITSAPHTKK